MTMFEIGNHPWSRVYCGAKRFVSLLSLVALQFGSSSLSFNDIEHRGMRLAVAFVAMRVLLLLAVAVAAATEACYVFPPEVVDPCRDVRCRHGARCVPAPDGRSASCHCPAACPDYGDHAASRPVCGSDGRSYRNQCELRREACRRAVDIGVRFHGKCGEYL